MPESHSKSGYRSRSGNAPPADTVRHLSPVEQPESVHEISDAIYQRFALSGVRLHIGGCQFDPIPCVKSAAGPYLLLNGQQIGAPFAQSLGLDELKEMDGPPLAWQRSNSRRQILHELNSLAKSTRLAEAADGKQWIVWCFHVHGNLVAEAGDSTVEIPFSAWAKRLKDGLDECPPYHCPVANVDTYHLAVDDEGTISDRQQIVRCPESGRRLVKSKLRACHETGALVDPAALVHCPVSNQALVQRLTGICKGCFQLVNARVLSHGRCESCRQLQKLQPGETEVTEWINARPDLNSAKRWRFASQPDHWLLQFAWNRYRWRLLVNRHSGRVEKVLRSASWWRAWQVVDADHWPEVFRSAHSQSVKPDA